MERDELVEALSEHVHRAWMTEKLRQGFADHPIAPAPMSMGRCTVCDKHTSSHHSDMLLYADLPEHIKEYDRVTVRAVLAGVEAEGLVLIAKDSLRRTRTAVAMLNSMVLSGESHSETSRAIVQEALA